MPSVVESPSRSVSQADCLALDERDPLKHLKDRFDLPEGVIYLDGNSLGALPKSVKPRLAKAINEEWGKGLIRSWNDAGWYPAPKRAGEAIARLIGADRDEVIVCDSISVNLFKLLIAALRKRPERKIIVSEKGNFPTDVYINAEAAELMGCELRCVEPGDVQAAIEEAGDGLALLQLTHVHYKTGAIYDMAGLTRTVQKLGGLVIWDLAHSAGTLPVDLNGCRADFAVGCGYKYLNGGPGAPAFVFVARHHLPDLHQPIAGWHGHARPFAFAQDYAPHAGIEKMLAGTSPQLSLIALEEALTVFDGVDMQVLRAKNRTLGDLFIQLVDQELGAFGFELASPRESAERGSQVSLTHPQGYAIVQALIARGIIGDFRAPDILRFGFAAPYVGYEDIWNAIAALKDIMATGVWDQPQFHARQAVT
ncbi:kynureninase [Roseibium hamelinense]|uniref:Kynureninase n=1 Tax=Roseibium hamelinense TaxID=150831 RepID=A0A562TG53_9HYPH|nr:kynureninase [Roseibium hamelinense]MTI43112.1 kynureninase [Roseibium hamelinense]TWI92541.1 kynureninase [Roseibium hamelinense]